MFFCVVFVRSVSLSLLVVFPLVVMFLLFVSIFSYLPFSGLGQFSFLLLAMFMSCFLMVMELY